MDVTHLPPGEEYDPNAEYEEVEEIVQDEENNQDDVRSQMYKAVSVDMPKEERESRIVKKLVKKEPPKDLIVLKASRSVKSVWNRSTPESRNSSKICFSVLVVMAGLVRVINTP